MSAIPVLEKIPSKPYKKWLFAKVLPDEVPESGIIETTDRNLKVHRVKVISTGPEVRYTKAGDTLRYTYNNIPGLEFLYLDEKYVFLNEDKHCLFVE